MDVAPSLPAQSQGSDGAEGELRDGSQSGSDCSHIDHQEFTVYVDSGRPALLTVKFVFALSPSTPETLKSYLGSAGSPHRMSGATAGTSDPGSDTRAAGALSDLITALKSGSAKVELCHRYTMHSQRKGDFHSVYAAARDLPDVWADWKITTGDRT